MPGPGTLAYAANVARSIAAKPFLSHEWSYLTTLMCWDAVTHCIHLAGFKRIPKLKRPEPVLARIIDPTIDSAAEMGNLPAGHVICFYSQTRETWLVMHAMLSVGGGFAAGTKNACVQVGSANGWEVVDLTQLNWSHNGYILRGQEKIYLHHRSIDSL